MAAGLINTDIREIEIESDEDAILGATGCKQNRVGAASQSFRYRGLDIMAKRTQCGLNPSGKVFIELETKRPPTPLDRNFDNSFANHVGCVANCGGDMLRLQRRILTQYRCCGFASGQVVQDYGHRNTRATKTNGTMHDSGFGRDV